MLFRSSLNLNDFGDGMVMLASGGSFEAPEISGDVYAYSDLVQGSNDDEYVAQDAFVGDASNVNIISSSAMFGASLFSNNDASSSDVLLNRNNFNELVSNNSVANFLENNYVDGNNVVFFDGLKTYFTVSGLNNSVANNLGLNFYPNFTKQNMNIIRSLNRNINNKVLSSDNDNNERAFVGSDYYYQKQNSDNN